MDKEIKNIITKEKLLNGCVVEINKLQNILEDAFNANNCPLIKSCINCLGKYLNNKDSIYFNEVVNYNNYVFFSFKAYFEINKTDFKIEEDYETYKKNNLLPF